MNFEKMKPQETPEYMPPESHDSVQMDKLPESQHVDDNGKKYRTDDGRWVTNNTFVLDGKTCKTDDSGYIYQQDGNFFPNDFFVVDGILYLTDENGELVFDDAPPEPEKVSLENAEQKSESYPCERVIDGEKYYYDSNGSLYRVDDQLLSNSTYELNGYKYETDDQGRIVSAEGKLHLKEDRDRLPIKDSIEAVGKGDQKGGDDRGHLIGDQFDGSNGLENLVPQDSNINRGDFKNFENELAREVKAGNEVYVKVEPVYDGNSNRPSCIVVTYSINGNENMRIFPND